MIKVLQFLVITIVLVSCGSVEKYNREISELHTPEELREDIDKAYFQLKKKHPKLYQYISKKDLDHKFDSLKGTINKPISSREFYEKLSVVVSSVKQGHTIISPPDFKYTKEEREKYKEKSFGFNLMDFEYMDEKLWVIGGKKDDSLLIGSEVIAVENSAPKDLIEKYNSLITSDGYNQTFYENMVGSRFPKYYRKSVGFLDSLNVTFKLNDSIFTKKYVWESSKKAKDTLKDEKVKLTKAERKASKLAQKEKHKKQYKYGFVKGKDEYTRELNFIGKDSSVAFMKIKGFSNGGFEDFYEESFSTLDSLQTKNLIIDLRNNGGGRLDEIDDLYSYLTDKDYTLINESEITNRSPFLTYFIDKKNSVFVKSLAVLFSPVIVTHNFIKTRKKDGKIYYKFRASKDQEPKPKNYKGKVYVLINGNSFSASSIFTNYLKATNRATLVGQETGGAYNGTVAGIYNMYELPNSKVIMRIGMMQIETPFKIEPDGYGVKPDIEIKPTRKDREEGNDPELQWILNDIESE